MDDAYRVPPPSGPTPRAELAAVRSRTAWRSFWRHRGEDVHAVATWIDDHSGVAAVAIFGAFVGTIAMVETADERACAETCESMGASGSADLGECHCIDENGKPWKWSEWPGVPRG